MDEPSPQQQPAKHTLFVYFPGFCVARVSINLRAKVGELRLFVPAHPSITFMFNGQILLENFSFEFYGVKPYDIVVVVHQAQRDDPARWLSLTRDNESFADRISSIINQKTAREAARLRDFQLLRMERKPKTFRRLCSAKMLRMAKGSGSIFRARRVATNIDYAPPDSPCTDELPSFWGSGCGGTADRESRAPNGIKGLEISQESDESAFGKIQRSITP